MVILAFKSTLESHLEIYTQRWDVWCIHPARWQTSDQQGPRPQVDRGQGLSGQRALGASQIGPGREPLWERADDVWKLERVTITEGPRGEERGRRAGSYMKKSGGRMMGMNKINK